MGNCFGYKLKIYSSLPDIYFADGSGNPSSQYKKVNRGQQFSFISGNQLMNVLFYIDKNENDNVILCADDKQFTIPGLTNEPIKAYFGNYLYKIHIAKNSNVCDNKADYFISIQEDN